MSRHFLVQFAIALFVAAAYAATGPIPFIHTMTPSVLAGEPATLHITGQNLQAISPKVWVLNKYIDAKALVLDNTPNSADIQVTMPEFRERYYAVLMLFSQGGQPSNNNARFVVQMPQPTITGLERDSSTIGAVVFKAGGEHFRANTQAAIQIPGLKVPVPTRVTPTGPDSLRISAMLPASPPPPYQATLRLTNPDSWAQGVTQFTVEALKPSIARIDPPAVKTGVPTSLMVYGKDFQNGLSILINGKRFTGTFLDPTRAQIQLTWSADDPRTNSLSIVNPGSLPSDPISFPTLVESSSHGPR